MRLKKIPILLLSASILAGCGGPGNETTEPSSAAESTTAVETTTAETTAAPETTTESTAAETGDSMEESADPLAGLTENEYEGLEISAVILPRTAIIPGSTIPVTVTVTNTGDKTVSYVQGSGSFTTPEALRFQIEELQPILPRDHLGIATMDYRINQLKPGDTIQYILNVRAIEPNENFDTYTYELFNQEESYIGDMDISGMLGTYSDLVPAAAGTYEGRALFLYQIIEDPENANPFGAATGYIQAPLTISVTE